MTAGGKRFEQPDGIVEKRVCGLTGGPPTKACEEQGLVTTDLYRSDMVDHIEGLAPFQASFKPNTQPSNEKDDDDD